MSNFTGKTVLILGGNVPLAVALAGPLNAAGASVIIGSAQDDPQVKTDLHYIWFTEVSLATPEIANPAAAALAPDVVILVPGWFKRSLFIQSEDADWDDALRINFEESTYALQAAGRSLVAGGKGGRIIVLSHVAALKAHLEMSAFATTLAALHVTARLAAVDLASAGVTVNVIALGWSADAAFAEYVSDTNVAAITRTIPAGRLLDTRDTVELIRFLASDDAQYITGAVIPLDGGYSIHKGDGGDRPPTKGNWP